MNQKEELENKNDVENQNKKEPKLKNFSFNK